MTLSPEALYPWLAPGDSPASPAAEPAPALPPVSAVPRLALTVAELAEAVGVSSSTIVGWLRRGEAPPHLRLPGNRLIRFPVASVERWLLDRAADADVDQDPAGDQHEP